MSNVRVIEKFALQTAAYKFQELAKMAEEFPEKFTKFVVIHYGDLPDDNYEVSKAMHGCNYLEAIGLLEMGKTYMATSGE